MIEPLLKAHYSVNGWVWGPVTMALLMGTGLYLTLLTRGVQFRWLAKALREVLGKVFTKTHAEGTVTYQVERDGMRLRWGLRIEDIPMDTILWGSLIADLERKPPMPCGSDGRVPSWVPAACPTAPH